MRNLGGPWLDLNGKRQFQPAKGCRLIPHYWQEMFAFDGVTLTPDEMLKLSVSDHWMTVDEYDPSLLLS